jgi:hypothetical protein
MQRPVLSNWQSLVDYCRAAMAYKKPNSSGCCS